MVNYKVDGMSIKNVGADGFVWGEDGTEFAPAELDPLGSNIGLSTPYIELNNNPPPSEDGGGGGLSNPFLLRDESPLMVNGSRVGCVLDGIAAPCSMAFDSLRNGSATIAAGTDRMLLGQLGIFEVRIPGDNHAPVPAGGDPSGAYGTLDRVEYFFASSWNLTNSIVPVEDKGQQSGPSEADKKCADKLAKLFSTAGAVASEGDYDAPNLLTERGSWRAYDSPIDPETDKPKYGTSLRNKFANHGATPGNELPPTVDRGGIIHVYPNESGHLNAGDKVGVYVPQGFTRVTGSKFFVGPSNLQWFENKALGLLISIAHVDTRRVAFGSKQNEQNSKLLGYFVTEGSLFQGSSTGYYVHTHISFWNPKTFNGNIRTSNKVDPRKYMCKEFGF